MLQLNLLPDVKLEYIKSQNRKRLVLSLAILSSGVALAIVILLFIYVQFWQEQRMKALDKDIDATVAQLKENQELDKILTVQNQLKSLPALHNDKMISSRTFDYLKQMTPTSATISDVTLDFDANTLNIKGNANALSTVNKFADTLKFTTFKVEGDNPMEDKAFSNVVLKSFSVEEGDKQQVSYELEMNFKQDIYTNSAPSTEGKSPVSFVVPNIISTRSATQAPSELFVPQPESEKR